MDFIFDLGEIILITIPIYIVTRILLMVFHKKIPWMAKLHEKIVNSKKEKVITVSFFFLSGIICYFFSEFFAFNNVQLGLVLGLFLGITNIFDSKMLN